MMGLRPTKEVKINGETFEGKTVVCVGANAGIGLAKCDYLVENKVSRLIMACRSTDKAEKARQEVVKKVRNGSTTVEVWKVDLASLSSCREFASKWNANPDNKIDILYLNAGLIAPNASLITSEDGLEMTYACNVLGHLAVIEQLLPSLALSDDPRIIFTGSSGAKMSTLPDHPGSNKRTPLRDAWSIGSYVLNAFNIYTDTKLLLAMVVRELQESFKNHPDEKYRKIFVANYHPGFVKTTISNKDHYGLSSLLSTPVEFLINRYAITPEVGARPGLYLGSTSIEQLPGGEFWDENAEPASLTAQYDNEGLRREYFERCIKDAGINHSTFPLP